VDAFRCDELIYSYSYSTVFLSALCVMGKMEVEAQIRIPSYPFFSGLSLMIRRRSRYSTFPCLQQKDIKGFLSLFHL
jgi:hypothetical protein